MKKLLLLSSLPLAFALAHVSIPKPAAESVSPALDLQEYIGEIETGVTESDPLLESSALGGGAALFSTTFSAPALFQRTLSFTVSKIHQVFSIIISGQKAPRLAPPSPIGFMLWFAHLGWYP